MNDDGDGEIHVEYMSNMLVSLMLVLCREWECGVNGELLIVDWHSGI